MNYKVLSALGFICIALGLAYMLGYLMLLGSILLGGAILADVRSAGNK